MLLCIERKFENRRAAVSVVHQKENRANSNNLHVQIVSEIVVLFGDTQRQFANGLLVGRESDTVGQELGQLDRNLERAVHVFGNIIAVVPSVLPENKIRARK